MLHVIDQRLDGLLVTRTLSRTCAGDGGGAVVPVAAARSFFSVKTGRSARPTWRARDRVRRHQGTARGVTPPRSSPQSAA